MICNCCERDVPAVRTCTLCGKFTGCEFCIAGHQSVRHFDVYREPSSDTETSMELDWAKGGRA